MAQHFLLSAAARSLSIGKVGRMSDRGAENVFARLRWPDTDGKPVCPDCGCTTCYDCRRGACPRWRCKACGCDFSVTSGTLFAWRKLPLKTYLLSIVLFCNEVKGKSMLAFSRDLGVQYKTAFVLAHKLREAMASSLRGLTIGGEGKVAEIDGAYFGGHVRPENLAADRVDRRLAENQSGKRKVVVVMRERDGRTLPQVFASEDASVSFIRARIAKGTVVHADESPAWNPLHAKFPMKRVNHQDGYSIDGACTNGAESYFSRMRRGELGHHHHIAGVYFVRYAQEAAWREDQPSGATKLFTGRLISHCYSFKIPVSAVDAEVIKTCIDELKKRGYKDQEHAFNSTARAWNEHIVPHVNKAAKIPLRETDKDRQRAFRRNLPYELRASIARFMRSLPFVGKGTRPTYRNNLFQAIRLLQADGIEVNTAQDLLCEKNVDHIAEHQSFGALDDISHPRKHILGTMSDLARFLGLRDVRDFIGKTKNGIGGNNWRAELEIRAELLNTLRPFDDLAETARLVAKLVEAVEDFIQSLDRSHFARAQSALGALIVLETCKERQDLVALLFSETELDGAARPLLILPKVPEFEEKLSSALRQLIGDFYWAVVDAFGRRPHRLFAKRDLTARDASTVGRDIAALVRACGHDLTLETLPAVPLNLLLLCDPAQPFEGLAGLMGFAATRTFINRYRPLLNMRAPQALANALKQQSTAEPKHK